MSKRGHSPAVTQDWITRSAWRAVALSFAAILVLTAVLNLSVNPFGLYSSQARTAPVDNLRIEKYEMLRQRTTLPHTVILGSSRVMMMAPVDVQRYIPGECFNYGMKSAMAEDYYAALLLLVEDIGAPVQHVILGIDLEAFHPGLPTLFEGRYFPQFRKHFTHATPHPSIWQERLLRLLSVEQTEESMNVLKRRILRTQAIQKMRIEPDGQAVQTAREQAIARDEFDLTSILASRVRRYPWRSLHLDTYEHADANRLRYMDELLTHCADNNISLHAFITPLHPAQWEVLDALPEASTLTDVTNELHERFAAHDVKLRDFSRISSFSGDPELFYDEMHMRPANHRLLLAELLGEKR